MLLHDTVRVQAERRPEAIAIVANQERITYASLEQMSNQLAGLLQRTRCGKGERVGLLMPKSIPAIVGILGTLKAGSSYVPLDIRNPPARLAQLISVCEPKCILATCAEVELLNKLVSHPLVRYQPLVGLLDSSITPDAKSACAFSYSDFGSVSSDPILSGTNENDTAHILFTSGSTGVPKGVVITHANVMSFLKWGTGYFGLTESDRIPCHSPLHFDLSTFDVYGTFLAGAQLHLVPPEISFLPHKLAAFIRQSLLTQWFSVPAALKYMAQNDAIQWNDFPSLKRVLWCGEALPTPTLMYLMKRLPHATFTNLYGPTESTIASSYYTVPSPPEHEAAAIPIGRACEGEELIVLDNSLRTLCDGRVGSLYIKGVGLSPGYWRDGQKTATSFITHPKYGRIYRTGDLAKIQKDGLVYLLGRSDAQIKSRGYRIELGEIEAALCTLGVLRESAVFAIETQSFEGTTICCAYVPANGMELAPSDLRERLIKVLPSYMVPSQWRAVETLPLNINGKVDRSKLKQEFLTGFKS
jgi:amino acid adenylation domain-containing protein